MCAPVRPQSHAPRNVLWVQAQGRRGAVARHLLHQHTSHNVHAQACPDVRDNLAVVLFCLGTNHCSKSFYETLGLRPQAPFLQLLVSSTLSTRYKKK